MTNPAPPDPLTEAPIIDALALEEAIEFDEARYEQQRLLDLRKDALHHAVALHMTNVNHGGPATTDVVMETALSFWAFLAGDL